MSTVAEQITKIKDAIAQACGAAGRDTQSVNLIAVSKTKPLELMLDAFAAGQRVFGENYVQELEAKQKQLAQDYSSLASQFQFHVIGPLQSNKVDRVVGRCALIHTVDRVKIAETINRCAQKRQLVQDVLLQVNISGEQTKSGIFPADTASFFESCLSLAGIKVLGLMCIGSSMSGVSDETVLRGEFLQMQELRDDLQKRFAVTLPHLSMGMSDDFALAIQHGSTLVRVGSAIFGAR